MVSLLTSLQPFVEERESPTSHSCLSIIEVTELPWHLEWKFIQVHLKLPSELLGSNWLLTIQRPKLCMELGCGSGYVITSLALMLGQEECGTHYFATDMNEHASRATSETLEAHGVHAEIIATNIASGLAKRLARSVDVIVVNPPYVPTPEEEVGSDGLTAAWAGGANGRSVMDRFLPVIDELLSPRGWLYMVTLSANNPQQICRVMRDKGYASRIVVQRSTEEEKIHILKFWRDTDSAPESPSPRKNSPLRKSSLPQLPGLSFWRHSS